MLRAPKYTFNAGINWTTDLGGGRFQTIANLYYSSKVYYDFRNLFFQKSYVTVSGELAWTTPNEAWRFSLWGRNLTNEAILQNLRPGAFGTDGIYDRPREIGVGASFRF
jgi:iron complex outermembrane receptor protein